MRAPTIALVAALKAARRILARMNLWILLGGGGELVIFDNLYRKGSAENLAFLKTLGKFCFHHGDIRDKNDVERAILAHKPDVVFHLAAQVAMSSSLIDPANDFEANALGTFNLLDSLRKHAPECIVIYASTNKVYGDLEALDYEETPTRYVARGFERGFGESLPLSFCSPYGCSKGAGEAYVLDFYRCFGLRGVVFRHSSMYGARQFATIDQGWIGYFINEALHERHIKISGNGKQVRDILHARDMVWLYLSAPSHIAKLAGNAYNIGGGAENALSIIELFGLLEGLLGAKISFSCGAARQSDQRVFIADLSKIRADMGFEVKIDKIRGLKMMIEWVKKIGG